MDPLDLCLLCLSTTPQNWILYQDSVCTIDSVAIVTALFQLQFLYFLCALYKPLSWPNLIISLSLAHNDLDNTVYHYN